VREMQTTEFRRLPLVELGRDGVIRVTTRGTVVGYWVPRDDWRTIRWAVRLVHRFLYRLRLLDDDRASVTFPYEDDQFREVDIAVGDALDIVEVEDDQSHQSLG